MTALAWFGLPHDADERAVKRAYAQRLKQIRPDEDPTGFQALHERYKAALQIVRTRDAAMPRVVVDVSMLPTTASVPMPRAATTEASPPAMPPQETGSGDREAESARQESIAFPFEPPAVRIPWNSEPTRETRAPGANSTEPDPAAWHTVRLSWNIDPTGETLVPAPARADAVAPEWDFEAFRAEFLVRAQHRDRGALRAWLEAYPPFWSLHLKHEAGMRLLESLLDDEFRSDEIGVDLDSFDTALAFFDLDNVRSQRDAVRVEDQRRTLHLRQLLSSSRRSLLASQYLPVAEGTVKPRLPAYLLVRPFAWWRILSLCIVPGLPTRLSQGLDRLGGRRVARLIPPLDARQVVFWHAAADQMRVSRARLIVVAARAAAVFLLCVVVLALATALDTSVQGRAAVDRVLVGAGSSARFVAAGLALWAIVVAWRALAQWQAGPDTDFRTGAEKWRLLFLPVLSTVSLVAGLLSSAFAPTLSGGPALLGAALCLLAIKRYRRRAECESLTGNLWNNTGFYGVLMCTVAGYGFTSTVLFLPDLARLATWISAMATFAAWVLDLVVQRRRRRAH